MKDFWATFGTGLMVIGFFLGFVFLLVWATGVEQKRCTERFGNEWHSNTSSARYGAPQCVNDKGEGKWLN